MAAGHEIHINMMRKIFSPLAMATVSAAGLSTTAHAESGWALLKRR